MLIKSKKKGKKKKKKKNHLRKTKTSLNQFPFTLVSFFLSLFFPRFLYPLTGNREVTSCVVYMLHCRARAPGGNLSEAIPPLDGSMRDDRTDGSGDGAKVNRSEHAERRRPSERLAALPTSQCDVRVPPLFLPFHGERREKGACTTSYPLLFCPCFARRNEETLRIIPRCQRIFSSKFFGRITFSASCSRPTTRPIVRENVIFREREREDNAIDFLQNSRV